MASIDPIAQATILASIVFVAFSVQAVTGFGAVILSLSVGALVVPIDTLLPVLVSASTALNLWFFVRDRGDIDRRVLLGRVLPWMGAGVGMGLVAAPYLDADTLTRGFGVFVVALAIWQLAASRSRRAAGSSTPRTPSAPSGAVAATAWLVAAGVVHGMVASGGPLLVHAVQREGLSPRSFRATLLTVWLTLNVVILVSWALGGRFTGDVGRHMVVAAPSVALAIIVGDRLHRHLDAERFRVVVYVVLAVSGVLLALRG